MPNNSWADAVRLLAEWYDTNSNIKLVEFRSQLQVSYAFSHTEESVCGWQYIYIYIYIVIHRQICFVLSELISVARQYLPVAGIETRLTQTPSQSF